MMDVQAILEKMTMEEKIALCSGSDFWHTKAMEKYDLQAIMMADGPHGLRKQVDSTDMLGINRALPATCFPTAVSTACSWDTQLLYKMGEALSEEARESGVSVVLGPGANIKRNPLCGRNFEYFSEDPYLTGKLAAAHIRGLEENGIGSSLKHFACNSQEYKRFSSDSIMDERTLREIYLTGFEMAVKEGKPSTVMCAYNKLNGVHCSDNKFLFTEVLREDWGFDGMVVTDWGALHDRMAAFKAGCDLSMPGGAAYMEKEALEAVRQGILSEEEIDVCAKRVLRLVEKGLRNMSDRTDGNSENARGCNSKVAKGCNSQDMMERHNELACRAAVESAVLLKNEDALLPLTEQRDVVFIGHMAKELRYQGAGSSHINPWKLTNVLDVCRDVTFAEGCRADGSTDEELLQEAAEIAAKAKAAVVFVGLTDQYESEGYDRDNMKLPPGHDRLVEVVLQANSNTVVVLLCGSAVELPWADKVKSILYMGLPGQAGGKAIVDLLFGRAVPSGKLAESWPYRLEDCISSGFYAHGKKDAHYREGLYVGYRYYTSAGVPVRYAFGHGLSYTEFAYSDLKIEGRTVSCKVTNIGKVAGKEIVQVYIKPPKRAFYRPTMELKAFCKVALKQGESKVVEFALTDRSFAIWNNGWFVPAGEYTILVGAGSDKLPLCGEISILNTEVNERIAASIASVGDANGSETQVPEWYFDLKGVPSHEDFEKLVGHSVVEKPLKKGEFTMENTVMEMKEQSFIMKIVYRVVIAVVSKDFCGKKDMTDPTYRMMVQTAADASLSGMKIFSGMNNYLLEGLLEMANGHFFRGIRRMLGRGEREVL